MFDPQSLIDLLKEPGALKTVSETVDLAKKLKELFGKGKAADGTGPVLAQARELISELTDKALTAKEESLALRARLLKVAEELTRFQKFEAERDAYALVELRPDSFAYRRKDWSSSTAPAPYCCAHCFEQEKRVVTLQIKKQDFGIDTLQCTACDNLVFKPNDLKMEIRAASPRRDYSDW